MTAWKIHHEINRKYIDSFMVDFPASHVSFRGGRRHEVKTQEILVILAWCLMNIFVRNHVCKHESSWQRLLKHFCCWQIWQFLVTKQVLSRHSILQIPGCISTMIAVAPMDGCTAGFFTAGGDCHLSTGTGSLKRYVDSKLCQNHENLRVPPPMPATPPRSKAVLSQY